MFELALQAGLPVIGVRTDDPVNFEAVVQLIAQAKPVRLPKGWSSSGAVITAGLFWTDIPEDVTVELYRYLTKNGKQLVVMNPDRHPLIFEAGELPTPDKMLTDYLSDQVMDEAMESTKQVLKGLSLKTVGEIVSLTQARSGNCSAAEIRKTRTLVMGATQGLSQVDTSFDFYVWPSSLKKWVEMNRPYFLGEHDHRLTPRGILLEGEPGVGKTMGAKALAIMFDVPLYRVDIATTLTKYVGDSEARFARLLQTVEREAPCVVLIDEVEKIFGTKDDSGVTHRLMSQLLWWLAEHKSKVFTVMTTNDSKAIPKELFRAGRVDTRMVLPKMHFDDAFAFALRVYSSVVSGEVPEDRKTAIDSKLSESGDPLFAHADVAEMVYTLMKTHGWA